MHFEAYFGLFMTALAAATLFPLSSEAVLLALVLSGQLDVGLLWLVATVGNVLGSQIQWWLGRQIVRWVDRPWFPMQRSAIEKGHIYFNRYGLWSLLLVWLPVIGDPLALVAGSLHVPFWLFSGLVLLGKALRYAFIIFIVPS